MSEMTPQEFAQWLKALDVGDQFAIWIGSNWSKPHDIFTITRVTATQLVYRNGAVVGRINRKTGRPLGKNRYSTIKPITAEIINANRRHDLLVALRYMREEDLKKLPTEALQAAFDALNPKTEVNHEQAA